jgi:hypothetical protein
MFEFEWLNLELKKAHLERININKEEIDGNININKV